MAQDTRKDPRAKVLTMTVRYKSATIDEFIEHHSHDVSRGGIFIKTPSPFLPGTLLKFEIRIADDKPMLQGVGRVVWKRDAPAAGPDKPAGMGVKFIKVDEASRNLIDRLVTSKGGAMSAYDAEAPAEAGVPLAAQPAPAPPVSSQRATQPGTRSAASPPSTRPQPQAAAGATQAAAPIRKATMIGLGADAIAAAAAAAQAAPRARSAPPRPAAEPMFPKTNSEAEMPPPEERTVMKQAAELLEEALKGAGGSIDELGATQVAPEPSRPAPTQREAPDAKGAGAQYQTVAGLGPAEKRPIDSTDQHLPSSQRSAASQRTPASMDDRDRAVPSARAGAAHPVRAVEAPALVEPASKKKSSGGRVVLSLLLVAFAAAGGYVAWQKLAPKPPLPVVEPPPPVATLPPPTPTPVVSVAPPIETAPVASAPAAASAAPAATAPTAASAGGAKTKPAASAAEKPAPAEKPAAAAPKPKPKPAAEEAAPAEKPEKTEKVEKPEKKKASKPAPDDNPY